MYLYAVYTDPIAIQREATAFEVHPPFAGIDLSRALKLEVWSSSFEEAPLITSDPESIEHSDYHVLKLVLVDGGVR